MSRPRRVVLGTGALALGALVSLLCCATVLAFFVGMWFGFWPALVVTLTWGAVPAIVLAFCLGAPLGILLQPVRNQWLHVAAWAWSWGSSSPCSWPARQPGPTTC